jgi:hypothetical protein
MEPVASAEPATVDLGGLNDETRTYSRPDMAPPAPSPGGWTPAPADPPPAPAWGQQAPAAPAAPPQPAPGQAWGAPTEAPPAPGQAWGAPPAAPAPAPGQGAPGQPWGGATAAPGQGAPGQAWGAAPAAPPSWAAPGAAGAPAPDAAWGGPAAPAAKKATLPAALAIVGGALTAIAVFLAWYTAKAGGLTESYSAWDTFNGGKTVPLESIDPLILLVLGIAVVGLGVLVLMGQAKIGSLLLLVAGVAVIGVAIRDWMSVVDVAKDLPSSVKISGGAGLYLTYFAGALTALAGGLGLAMGAKR